MPAVFGSLQVLCEHAMLITVVRLLMVMLVLFVGFVFPVFTLNWHKELFSVATVVPKVRTRDSMAAVAVTAAVEPPREHAVVTEPATPQRTVYKHLAIVEVARFTAVYNGLCYYGMEYHF